MWTAVALAAAVVVLFLYANWTARRLDRLHSRVDAAAAALHAQLLLRAEAALTLAESGALENASAERLRRVAEPALAAHGLGHDREIVENTLSRCLAAAVDTATDLSRQQRSRAASAPVDATVEAAARASMARRFHNDAVRDALVVRRRRIVRWLHLAGHAPQPSYFEIDDAPLEKPGVATPAAPYD
ncbi:MAG: hypothetical protein JO222_02805 [Frankiales bacterium]|nr:hypothetical protein [Frankiales bacterium]